MIKAAALLFLLAQSAPYDFAADPKTGPHHARFKSLAEAVRAPLEANGKPIPGAFWQTRVIPLSRCVTRVEGWTPAFTFNGAQQPAQVRWAFDLDWTKIRRVMTDGTVLAFLDGRNEMQVPIGDAAAAVESVTRLQLACGAFSALTAGLPSDAKPWGQMLHQSKNGLACHYAGVPDLVLEQSWSGDDIALWQRRAQSDPQGATGTRLVLRPLKAPGNSWEVTITLANPANARASAVELRVNNVPVRPLSGIDHKNQAITVTPGDTLAARALVDQLKIGQALEARALDAGGRELIRATFDIRDVRQIEPALESTRWNCILQPQ